MESKDFLKLNEVFDSMLLASMNIMRKKIEKKEQFNNKDYNVLKIIFDDYCKLLEVRKNEYKKF